MPRIHLASVFVDDQDRALAFYTDVLGFRPMADVPLGADRWLTVVSADEPDGTQLLLEPNSNNAARTYQRALFRQQIPATSFAVDDADYEYERLTDLGAHMIGPPTDTGKVKVLVVDDTCGNWIQLAEQLETD